MLQATKCHLCYARIGHGSKPAIKDFNSCAAFAPFVRNGINARRNREEDERERERETRPAG